MRSRRWVRVVALAVCVLFAAAVGAWQGWRNVTVDPPAPPAVCPLVRTEVFDRLVPAHGPPQVGEQNAPGMRSNYCLVKSTHIRATYLWVSLGRFGRHEGRGPRCVDRDGLQTVVNGRNHPLALGDSAVYFLAGDPATGRRINFSTCLGTYGVVVAYEAYDTADAAMVESAAAVAQEVLSWL
ncbi:hypothetical protein [Micromonospora sp. NPDC049274]|uniref:hypothetical protein n=1 Tax=Micromonospora sp. NPDC049274 TaxID=3154829 RepID=UPI0034314233